MTEKKMWREIKKISAHFEGLHVSRIETSTENGVPDVLCVYKEKIYLVELKVHRAALTSCDLHLSSAQLRWFTRSTAVFALVYIECLGQYVYFNRVSLAMLTPTLLAAATDLRTCLKAMLSDH